MRFRLVSRSTVPRVCLAGSEARDQYHKVSLISACAYFVSGKKLCAYYMYALITHTCTKPVYYVYRDQRSLNTTGLQCSEQQSSTDLHAVPCNLGKLNAGAKIHASHI